jgi:F-type H+-transporting ATPase subunit delta
MSLLAAKRYAKALLSLALERNALESVYQDMDNVADTVRKSRDLKVLLSNPIVKTEKKRAIIATLFGKANIPITTQFFDMVSSRHREAILGEIAESFIQEYRTFKKISTVEIASAVPLSEGQRQSIVKLLVKDPSLTIEIVQKIDPTLVGGFIVRTGDQQIDASVSRKLRNMKLELAKPIMVN